MTHFPFVSVLVAVFGAVAPGLAGSELLLTLQGFIRVENEKADESVLVQRPPTARRPAQTAAVTSFHGRPVPRSDGCGGVERGRAAAVFILAPYEGGPSNTSAEQRQAHSCLPFSSGCSPDCWAVSQP